MATTGIGTNAAIVPTVSPGTRLDPLAVLQVDSQLSLANGMTAGFGVNDGNNSNPPAVAGQYGRHPWPAPQRVGFLRNIISVQGGGPQANGQNPANSTGLYTLYFIYNPNQITSSWATNPTSTPPLYLYQQEQSAANSITQFQNSSDQSAQIPAYASSQSISWSLYFDRTYDMLYGGNGDGSSPQDDRGVLKDVAALYNLMGTFITSAAVPISTPCEVVFGQNGAGQLWGFTGFISSINVTYGIFRHDMIPSRCEVDLTMTTTYVTNGIPAAASQNNTTINGQVQSGTPNTTANAIGTATRFSQQQ